MVTYNPKDWWKLIFAFRKSDTFRMILPGMLAVAAYTGIIAFLENDVFHASFKNTTAVHTLVGFVLSLVLVFRTNTAYDRWWLGRSIWGSVVNDSRNFIMKINSFVIHPNSREVTATLLRNFPFALKNHLRGNTDIEELASTPKYNYEYYYSQTHVPLSILKALHDECYRLLKENVITNEQLMMLQQDLNGLGNSLGACERIKNTPIPYSYNIFIKKVIFIYVFTMPIGFVREFGYWSMIIVALIFYVFSSIELIAEEIEDPFSTDENDLPLEHFCNVIDKNIAEVMER